MVEGQGKGDYFGGFVLLSVRQHLVVSYPDDTTPVPTTEPADLHAAAVLLTTPPNNAAPCDRRRATLLLHTADDDLDSNLALAGNRPGAAPVGVFQPTIDPAFPVIPNGYEEIVIAGLGRILWPAHLPPPARIVAPDTHSRILYQRTTRDRRPS